MEEGKRLLREAGLDEADLGPAGFVALVSLLQDLYEHREVLAELQIHTGDFFGPSGVEY